MTNIVPIFASDRNAAKLLDLKQAVFCALVDGGHLPKPIDIGGYKRWDVEQLRRISSGEVIDGDIQW